MGSTQTFALSFGVGAGLIGLTFIFAWLSTTTSINGAFLQWLGIPIAAYLITFGLNASVQKIICGSVDAGKLAMLSGLVPLATLIGIGIASVGIFRSPIASAVPLKFRVQFGTVAALAFYMFWAGMFGEAIAGGYALSCPSA